VKEVPTANTIEGKERARIVEEVEFVNMVKKNQNAGTVEEVEFVNMVKKNQDVRTVVVHNCVNLNGVQRENTRNTKVTVGDVIFIYFQISLSRRCTGQKNLTL